jgi:DME family drug/metabolite transporter
MVARRAPIGFPDLLEVPPPLSPLAATPPELPAVHPWRGRALVVVTALLWSTSGFFVKAPFFEGWPGVVLAFWRAVFAGLIILPLVRRPVWRWGMLPMVGCFAAMSYTYLTSMSLMSKGAAGSALWLQCTAPVWVLLAGVFVFGEKAVWRDWLLVGCSAIGVAVMILFRTAGAPPLGIFLGLLSGVFYAGIILSMRQLRSVDSAWLAVLNQGGTALALGPLALQYDLPSTGTQWLLLAAFGVFQLGLPYVLFGLALRDIPGHEASVIGLLEPLLLPVWIALAWGDAPDAITFVGGGWILAGLLLRYGRWPVRRAGESLPE